MSKRFLANTRKKKIVHSTSPSKRFDTLICTMCSYIHSTHDTEMNKTNSFLMKNSRIAQVIFANSMQALGTKSSVLNPRQNNKIQLCILFVFVVCNETFFNASRSIDAARMYLLLLPHS